jgi:hypothetical protein
VGGWLAGRWVGASGNPNKIHAFHTVWVRFCRYGEMGFVASIFGNEWGFDWWRGKTQLQFKHVRVIKHVQFSFALKSAVA